jgi:hypothetical protein
MRKLTDLAEAIYKERDEWLSLESNWRHVQGDFNCAIYVSEDYWGDIRWQADNMRGLGDDLPWLFYTEQKVLGFPIYIGRGRGKDGHPPFAIYVTS